jgi:hypothetical protein
MKMNYTTLLQEWDATCEEMAKFSPELDDEVLCCNPEIHVGHVESITDHDDNRYYMVRLEDGSVDEFADEDVLKRKVAS